jgi:hypothetical protein
MYRSESIDALTKDNERKTNMCNILKKKDASEPKSRTSCSLYTSKEFQ